MTVKVWHFIRHDDAGVTEITTDLTFETYLYELYNSGGLRMGDFFIPWHRLKYFEKISD